MFTEVVCLCRSPHYHTSTTSRLHMQSCFSTSLYRHCTTLYESRQVSFNISSVLPGEKRLQLSNEVIGNELSAVRQIPAVAERQHPTTRLLQCLLQCQTLLVVKVVDFVARKVRHQRCLSLSPACDKRSNAALLQTSLSQKRLRRRSVGLSWNVIHGLAAYNIAAHVSDR